MSERVDVVVVGARCAGAPLAALLARQGLKVVVLERATFPRDTLSTHVIHCPGLAFLDELGLTEQLRATGAYFTSRCLMQLEDVTCEAAWPQTAEDPGGVVSVRRFILDPMLVGAANEAGADIRMGTTVTGLVHDAGRVTGVRAVHDGTESIVRARVVVGADGRNSTVAGLVGARKYNLTRSERFAYWGFFEDARPGEDPPVIFYRWSDRMVFGCPADSGLYQVIVVPDLRELPRFREDLEGSFMEHATSARPVGEALAGAHRVGKLFGIVRWEGFLREATGPGWVLAGDAGYFKDPTPGQGIEDAFRQVQALAPAITQGMRRHPDELDRLLREWALERDKDAAEHYWLATDLGKGGPMPAVLPELVKRLVEKGEVASFLDLFNHRSTPSKVVSPPRVLGATGRLLKRPGSNRRAIISEVGELIARDMRHKRLNRRPAYIAASAAPDAGATECEDTLATV